MTNSWKNNMAAAKSADEAYAQQAGRSKPMIDWDKQHQEIADRCGLGELSLQLRVFAREVALAARRNPSAEILKLRLSDWDKLQDATRTIEELRNDIKILQADLVKREDTSAMQGARIITLSKEIESLRAEILKLRLAIAGNLGGDDLVHSAPLEQLEQACDDACDKIVALWSECESLRTQLAEKCAECNRLRIANDRLEEKPEWEAIMRVQALCDKLRAESESLRSALAEKCAECNLLKANRDSEED